MDIIIQEPYCTVPLYCALYCAVELYSYTIIVVATIGSKLSLQPKVQLSSQTRVFHMGTYSICTTTVLLLCTAQALEVFTCCTVLAQCVQSFPQVSVVRHKTRNLHYLLLHATVLVVA